MEKKVAIVGYSFRLPGADSQDLWEALLTGEDLVTEVEDWRWSKQNFLHPNKSEPGSSYTFSAGSVSGVDRFDAGFFGISPREAEQMDPQQRFLLEMAWNAFEQGGIKPSSVRGTNCGVYVGVASSDYVLRRTDDLASTDSTTMTGGTVSIAANRLSYLFDLRGPSLAVDTACSSSLVAFHQARRAIATGEISQALVGGISLLLHPLPFLGFAKATMLSPEGRCKVFDASGKGYVRSEGGGVFILKDLDAAIAEGNEIHAVIAGSGINCDGKTNGLTVPGAETQAALMRQVYAQAGIGPDEVDYLEAHGTGTAVGDPIETRAIGDALGSRRAKEPLLIGSIKSNLGHLEAASGVAGLVKALLCLRHRRVPGNIHLRTPNANIDFEGGKLRVVTETTELDPVKRLTIGVNSFGYGGANAHVVLQTPEPVKPAASAKSKGLPPFLLLSGRGQAALRELAGGYAQRLGQIEDDELYSLCHSALRHREWLQDRLVVQADNRQAMQQALAEFADGTEQVVGASAGSVVRDDSQSVFVYVGNGSQWAGMAQALLRESPEFRASIEAVDALFVAEGGFSIVTELGREPDACRYELTEVAQPTLFAIQVAITEWLAARGVKPAAVVGHSVGEVAAAWACGALTLEQAVHVVHERSEQQGKTRGTGGMTAVALGAEQGAELIADLGLGARLAVAGINSSRSITVSGPVDDLTRLEQVLTERQARFKRLALDYAFHGPLMDPIEQSLIKRLQGLMPADGDLPFYSTVTGGELAGGKLDADYWWHNVREPVRFAEAIGALIEQDLTLFVEIGPHAILKGYLSECLRDAEIEGRSLPTLQREDDDLARLRAAFADCLISGIQVDLDRHFPVPAPLFDLPTYPWQRERYWMPTSPESSRLLDRRESHPLLGAALAESTTEWEARLDPALQPMLTDHVVDQTVVFPGAGYLDMALAANAQWKDAATGDIAELEILSPMLLDDAHSRRVRFSVDPSDGRFFIKSRPRVSDEPWNLHVMGRLLGEVQGDAPDIRLSAPERSPDLTATEHYALTTSVGLDYGPAFQAVRQVWLEPDQLIVALAPAAGIDPADGLLHATLVDGCFQILVDLLRDELGAHAGVAYVPVKIGRTRLYRPGETVSLARMRLLGRAPRSLRVSYELFDQAGELIATLDQVRFRAVPIGRSALDANRLYRFEAAPAPLAVQQFKAALPRLTDVVELGSEFLHSPDRQAERVIYYEEIDPLLDVLCAAAGFEAVRKLVADRGRFDLDSLRSEGRLIADQRSALAYWLAELAQDGLLEEVNGGWTLLADAELPSFQDVWNSLIVDYPDYAAEFMLAGRVGSHLAELWDGSMAARTLLPAAADNPTLQYLRGASPSLTGMHKAVASLLSGLFEQLPAGRRLRVLEVCDEASYLGPQLLPEIAFDRCQYVVAAANDAALDQIDAQFEHYPLVELLVWNPDDGECADLEACFDLILVQDGLSTARAPQTLAGNLRRQLAEGGVLVALEQSPSRWASLVLGTDPAYWSAQRVDGGRRQRAESWQALLATAGFTSDILTDLADVDAGPYLLLATSTLASAAPVAEPPTGYCLLLGSDRDDAKRLNPELHARLTKQGLEWLEVLPGEAFESVSAATWRLNPAAPADYARLFDELAKQGKGVHAVLQMPGWAWPSGEPSVQLAQGAEASCIASHALLNVLASQTEPPRWLVLADGAVAAQLPDYVPAGRAKPMIRDAALWGLLRTAINEYPELPIRLIDTDLVGNPAQAAEAVIAEILDTGSEDEIILTAQGRFAPRLREVAADVDSGADDSDEKTGIQLNFDIPGPLKNLHWRRFERHAPAEEQVEIAVRATGLNFRDVMYAMGLLSDEAVESGFAGPTLGMELSGVITRVGPGVDDLRVGDEVIAFAPASFSTHVLTQAAAVVPKPPDWSFAAAASIPTTFFTVYYALHQLARLEAGERILIHGAAGGVGIAAIQFARLIGAEIFATAGSDEKRDFVRLLGADHVLDSRSLRYADDIMRITGGEGVDVVLNSLAGEAINRNFEVLRPFGRFLELGKRDFYENTRIGLRPFRNNISYFGIDADQLMSERPELTRRLFEELMELFLAGDLKPLPYRLFSADQIVDAFRYMQQSKQIGKIVVSFDEPITEPRPLAKPAPSLELSGAASYLVTGGLSGFGLATARWLADKGARHLVLISRGGKGGEDADRTIAELEAMGVSVHARACDVTDRAALERLFAEIDAELPPLRGIVHAAMVIVDGLLRNLTADDLGKVLAPKVAGARYLHELTVDRELDLFLLYSSATTLFGNPGQANYVAGNRFLEALAEQRRAQGLPATCVLWGAIEDAGYLARNEEIKEALSQRMGGAPLHTADAFRFLEGFLLSGQSGVGVMELDWSAMARFLPSAEAPKFAEIAAHAGDLDADLHMQDDIRKLLDQSSPEELRPLLIETMKKEVSEILRIPVEKLDEEQSVYELGMDSLMGMELIAAVESRFGVKLPVMALSEGPTIAKLVDRILLQVAGDQSAESDVPGDDAADQVRQLAAQHGQDLDQEEMDKLVEDLTKDDSTVSGKLFH